MSTATAAFRDLVVNTVFSFGGETYRKTETVRVSCCKTINCVKVSNNEQNYISDDSVVEIKNLNS